MKKFNSKTLLLIGGISVVGLTGCERLEQAANDALEKAKQSAVQVLDEAGQSGSIDQAKQSANQVLLETKQTATGLLGQASEYLSQDPQTQDVGNTVAGDQASTL
jgi:hypothetical protein